MTLSKKYREENDEGSVGQFKSMFAYRLKHMHTSNENVCKRISGS